MTTASICPVDDRVVARFWSKVDKRGVGGCWLWVAGLDKDGYGQFGIVKRKVKPHRLAYELLVGPIPAGLEIDHLCRVRCCVNPAHLEPVTRSVNNLRGDSLAARRARQTHCLHGHPFSPENTYVDPRGRRCCRSCSREYFRRRRARLKAAA